VEIAADKLGSLDAAYLRELFADAHHRTFMHGAKTDRPIEIVTLRVGATLPIGTHPNSTARNSPPARPTRPRFSMASPGSTVRATPRALNPRDRKSPARGDRKATQPRPGVAARLGQANSTRQTISSCGEAHGELNPIDYAVISRR